MRTRDLKPGRAMKGYSLVEMLIVVMIIVTLATMPIALFRRSRDKIFEAEALRALRMVAVAYENYYSQNDFQYPNYQSNGAITEYNQFHDAEAVWDELNGKKLLPGMYAFYPHDRRDLLAHGYRFSIFPSNFGSLAEAQAPNTYVFAMMRYPGSLARRDLVMVHGVKFFTMFPSAVPREMGGMSLLSTTIYAIPDETDR
jgi:prepilin-type N-terminal cleavage/methylation domain-containing protein